MSDLARIPMQKLSVPKTPADPLWHEVGGLRSEIPSLSMEVDRLSRMLEARNSKGDGVP